MGLGSNSSGGSKTYLNIVQGTFRQRVAEDTPGAISRLNKNEVTVHELHHNWVSGQIVGLSVNTESDYGTQIEVVLDDGGEKFQLQASLGDSYGRSIISRWPNLNLSEEVKLTPYDFEDDNGKRRQGISVMQSGNKVPSFYTKETPNGMPPLKEVKKQGKTTWDSTDLDNFIYEKALEASKQLVGLNQQPVTTINPDSDGAVSKDVSDDLPF